MASIEFKFIIPKEQIAGVKCWLDGGKDTDNPYDKEYHLEEWKDWDDGFWRGLILKECK